MENKTEVIAQKGKQDVIIIRDFEAPRELVFKAFSTPELLVQFFAPEGSTMFFNFHDYRTGGSYSWGNKNKDGKVVCTFNGVIHELQFPERIIQTAELMELPERGHAVLELLTFEELSADRTRLTMHDVCFSEADRDAMVQSGMEGGLLSIFRRLDALLTIQITK